MATSKLLIYLLRRDLRVVDNAILHHLASTADHGLTHLLPIYVFQHHQIELSGLVDDGKQCPFPPAQSRIGKFWRCGPHRARFLAQAVWDLKDNLEARGSGLIIRAGNPVEILDRLIQYLRTIGGMQISAVWMTDDVAYEEVREQDAIGAKCAELGIDFKLWPDEKYFIDDRDTGLKSAADLPDVFTTYRKSQEPLRSRPRRSLSLLVSPLPTFPSSNSILDQEAPFKIPETLFELEKRLVEPLAFELPNPPKSSEDVKTAHPFAGGERNAMDRLKKFIISGAMSTYADTRNGMLGKEFSTKLSAFLALGCLSARQIHDELLKMEDGKDAAYERAPGYGEGENAGTKAVRLELLWRDYMRLCTKKFGTRLFQRGGFRQDDGYKENWKIAGQKVAEPAQHSSPEATGKILTRFLEGSTGMGLIDASQRELYFTGYTSMRARQNVASFLTKHLGLDWRYGAEWYESLLVDYDVSSNWANWQYVAGVGNDPRGDARIFNPVKQAFDYDEDGEYVRTWVPEVKGLKNVENVFQVCTSSAVELEKNGLSSNIMVIEPLKRIDFIVDRRPKNSRRPYHRGRGGGGGNDHRGNRRGSLSMSYGRGAPPLLNMMPMSDNMVTTQLVASSPTYCLPMEYEAAYAWSPTLQMPPPQPLPMHLGAPVVMASSGWLPEGLVYGEYMPFPVGPADYMPRVSNKCRYRQNGGQVDNQNRGR